MDKDFLRVLELGYTELQKVYIQRLLVNEDKCYEALLMFRKWEEILNPKAEEEEKERDRENSSSTGN